MEWVIIVIVAVVIIFALLSQTESWKRASKAADIIHEYQEKQKLHNNNTSSSDDELLEWIKNNPDDGGSDWLDKASELIPDNESYLNSESLEEILLDLDEYDESDDCIGLPIKGINFRNLNNTNIGSFSGYIAPDKENKFDKYAIGIYSEDGTHFGYIEKDQKYFFDFIESKGGYIDAVLDISTFIDDDTGKTRFHGIVAIDKADLV